MIGVDGQVLEILERKLSLLDLLHIAKVAELKDARDNNLWRVHLLEYDLQRAQTKREFLRGLIEEIRKELDHG